MLEQRLSKFSEKHWKLLITDLYGFRKGLFILNNYNQTTTAAAATTLLLMLIVIFAYKMLTLAKLLQMNFAIITKDLYIFAAPLWQEQPAVRILLLFESGTQKGTTYF